MACAVFVSFVVQGFELGTYLLSGVIRDVISRSRLLLWCTDDTTTTTVAVLPLGGLIAPRIIPTITVLKSLISSTT